MIDILVLANDQFRAIFPFWQWIIHQTSHLLGCSSWKVTLKLLRKNLYQKEGVCVFIEGLYSQICHFPTQMI